MLESARSPSDLDEHWRSVKSALKKYHREKNAFSTKAAGVWDCVNRCYVHQTVAMTMVVVALAS